MDEVKQILWSHFRMYPGMEIEDCIKLLYQQEMGMEHFLENKTEFRERLIVEREEAKQFGKQGFQSEDIGGGLHRLHLQPLSSQLTSETVATVCALSAEEKKGTIENLIFKLNWFKNMVQNGETHYAPHYADKIQIYINQNCPTIHHSGRYRGLYNPHYRLIDSVKLNYIALLETLDALLSTKPSAIVSIEGMAASGKSSLADLLEDVYNCGIVHTDDFFLRPEQRNEVRLAQPGGNIDYERLAPIAEQAALGREMEYSPYNCQTQKLEMPVYIPARKLTLVEGVYAMHPLIKQEYDLSVFLMINAQKQQERIRQRNAPELANRFMQEWIPMENRYFSEFKVRENCGLVFDTSTYW